MEPTIGIRQAPVVHFGLKRRHKFEEK